MIEETKKFYDGIGITDLKGLEEEAVVSLTTGSYANQYKQKFSEKIYDNESLATLGDAVCSAILLKKEYKKEKSMEDMNGLKKRLTNKELNIVGEKMLKDKLFSANGDLGGDKGYATAFEAVIGFVSLVDLKKAEEIFFREMEKWNLFSKILKDPQKLSGGTIMEFETLIKQRYSCKKYDPSKKVDDITLKKILEAERLAPTARNAQEQHVYVLRNDDPMKNWVFFY